MNIEDLSKSQLLLLTVLVNFVMSIATGIVTVSLLDQAPPNITQTVNRIVEHTVETVVPQQVTKVIEKPSSTVQQQPSEEDQLVAAISGTKARTVTIYNANKTNVIAVGTYLPKARAVVTAAVKGLPSQAVAVFSDGTSVQASLSKRSNAVAIYGFADEAALPAASAAALLDASSLKQGQAVIALTADGSAVTGIISKIAPTGISTTLPTIPDGAAAVSLSGGLVGVHAGDTFIGANAISSLLSATSTSEKP